MNIISIFFDHIGWISFVLVAYVCFITARGIYLNNKATKENKDSFWNRESEANSVRRKDISNLDYIIFPENLPINSLITIGRNDLSEEFKSFSDKKMLNLSKYTNTDLKLMYGPANLDQLSRFDENYALFIRLLNNISTALLKAEPPRETEALTFLEYSISIGSDISYTYINLAELYVRNGDTDKIDTLITKAEGLSSLSASAIVTKLNNIKLQDK